jgi:hypothetical protein
VAGAKKKYDDSKKALALPNYSLENEKIEQF